MPSLNYIPAIQSLVLLLGYLWQLNVFAAPFPVLVDAEWLKQHHTEVVILDVRPRDEYRNGHLPGARWAGFSEHAWQMEYYGVPGYLPNEEELTTVLGQFGLYGSESIVVTGSAGSAIRIAEAARVVWSLMTAGFQQVALLDGGIESLSDKALSKENVIVKRVDCRIHLREDLLAETNDVEGLLDNNGFVVDFRPNPYYEGVKRDPRVPLAGTILEAWGYPAEYLLDETSGMFLNLQTLKKDFNQYGIPLKGPVAAFSDTGVWGALGWFVMHRLLGNDEARLYDGSMVEWIDWGGEVYDSTDDMGGAIG